MRSQENWICDRCGNEYEWDKSMYEDKNGNHICIACLTNEIDIVYDTMKEEPPIEEEDDEREA